MTKSNQRSCVRTRTNEKSLVLIDENHVEADLRDISASGAQLRLRERPAIGRDIVVYTEEFGRLQARVVRHSPTGIGLSFRGGEPTRKTLLQRLTRYADRVLGKSPGQASGSHRLFLETLAISGRIAAEPGVRSATFWTMVEDCKGRGWVRSASIGQDYQAIEITRLGRAQLETSP